MSGGTRLLPHQLPRRRGALSVLPLPDINVKNTSLRQALRSPLFTALRDQDVLMEEHSGGCVLFERKDAVEALLAAVTK